MTEEPRIPRGLVTASSLAWRGLLVATAVAVVLWLIAQLAVLVVPVVLALILTALLAPVARVVNRVPLVPRGVATGVVVAGGLAVAVGVLWWAVAAFLDGLPSLSASIGETVVALRDRLAGPPFRLDDTQLAAVFQSVLDTLQRNQAALANNVIGALGTAGELAAETLLMLFVLIFLIHDGARIWRFVLGAVPQHVRRRADVAGRRAFASLVGYTRATVVVAAVDAVTAAVGLWAIGVPLVVPLATLIFFGAFVPTVGAVVTGIVAVLVALASGGWVDALLVIGLLLIVQNVEGYILQPLLLGRSVRLHPLAVVLPISAGLIVGGVPGALLAVPLVTLADAGVRSLRRPGDGTLRDAGTVDPLDPRSARPLRGEGPGPATLPGPV
ncbi:AI-2E family transporter [Pseudonocardia sp. EV170527-09]|uniref:AI-2E family transporter n=1 Tax=Pseudonocardia sp. EV170527-09 TaxID=2603411 RepID=UPI0011F2717F|nr:AI-2E family transporter [Pseudonocardia sp. EV170527-09]KAA1022311.1 AI-2E family transporter [Pseudonocardia sp. EV170527-09]